MLVDRYNHHLCTGAVLQASTQTNMQLSKQLQPEYSDAKINVVFDCVAGGTQLNLPQFPQTRELKLPASLPADRLNTFLAMYRVHSLQLYRLILSQVPTYTFPPNR